MRVDPEFVQLVVTEFEGRSALFGLTETGEVYLRKYSRFREGVSYWRPLSMRLLPADAKPYTDSIIKCKVSRRVPSYKKYVDDDIPF